MEQKLTLLLPLLEHLNQASEESINDGTLLLIALLLGAAIITILNADFNPRHHAAMKRYKALQTKKTKEQAAATSAELSAPFHFKNPSPPKTPIARVVSFNVSSSSSDEGFLSLKQSLLDELGGDEKALNDYLKALPDNNNWLTKDDFKILNKQRNKSNPLA